MGNYFRMIGKEIATTIQTVKEEKLKCGDQNKTTCKSNNATGRDKWKDVGEIREI